nr:unnamed protein product [Callosobruchus chinensis]
MVQFIQKSLSKILFIQYFSSSCELAAFLIFMLTSNSFFNALRSLGAFTMLAYEVFVVFWFANEVQIQSVAVSDAIYLSCNWIKYGKKVNNTLLQMLLRSQTPASFKAFFIGNVSLSSFTRVHLFVSPGRPPRHPDLRPIHLHHLHVRVMAVGRDHLQNQRSRQGHQHRSVAFVPDKTIDSHQCWYDMDTSNRICSSRRLLFWPVLCSDWRQQDNHLLLAVAKHHKRGDLYEVRDSIEVPHLLLHSSGYHCLFLRADGDSSPPKCQRHAWGDQRCTECRSSQG